MRLPQYSEWSRIILQAKRTRRKPSCGEKACTLKILFKKKDFIYYQRERGDEKDKERETSMCGCLSCAPNVGGTWPATQACALTET